MFTKKDAYRVFINYSIASRAFMQLVFTVNLIYFVTVAGLDPLQMVLVGTTLELAIFIFEVPTGVVADTLSRRLSVIIGVFLIGSGFIVQALVAKFYWILFSQVLWGVGYTFTSGALQAWISDEIGEVKAAAAFLHATQQEQIGGFVAIGLSFLFASSWQLQTPILLGGILFWILGGYLLVFMPETGFSKSLQSRDNSWMAMRSTLKQGFSMIRKRPVLFRILLVGLFFGLYSEGLDRLWVPHLIDRFHLPDQGLTVLIGWVAGINASGMILTYFSTRGLRKFIGENADLGRVTRAILSMACLLVISIVIFALSKQLWLAFLICIFISVLRDLISPLYIAWVNHRLDSSSRATVLSMSSLVDAFGQIGGGPIVGLIAQQINIQAGLLSSAILLSPVVYFLKNNQKRIEE